MPESPLPLRFTLVNFFALPAVLLIPFLAALLIATNGMSSDGAIQTALNLLDIFLYAGPLLLIAWTGWMIWRLKRYTGGKGIRNLNRLLIAVPYAVVLVAGGYLAWQDGYARYQKNQTLQTRAATVYQLPASVMQTHHIGKLMPGQGTLLAFPDSAIKAKAGDTLSSVCLIRHRWKNNNQEVDTQYYPANKVRKLVIQDNEIVPSDETPDLVKANAANPCLSVGKSSNRPDYTGISRYGESSSGADQFEAYVAGADKVRPVLIGFQPFDYQLLNGLIPDQRGHNWFFMRKQDALFAGFLKKDGTSKVYQLEADGLNLPDSRQKPRIQGLIRHNNKVWLYSPQQVFAFKPDTDT